MHARTPLLISITLVLLGAAACASPSPVARHWGEARNASREAQIAAGSAQPQRDTDGPGADAAYGKYVKSLEPSAGSSTPASLLDLIEGN